MPGDSRGISQDTALKYSAFFACARVLAETFASVSINEYHKLNNGDREQTDDTGLYPILHYSPNSETSAYNFQECMMYQINLGGNFVAERIMSGNRIVGLSQMQWQDYSITRDKNDLSLNYNIIGNDVKLKRNQVLHIPGPSVNGFVGMSVLEYASSSIRLGETYESFGQKFYNNSAMPSGIFRHPSFLKEQSFKNLKEEIDEKYVGLTNTGRPILVQDGLEFEQLTIKPIDAELLSSKRFQIEDICRYFRVQPHLIQHLEKSSFSNIEMQSLEFVMYTMLPHFKRVEQNINNQLLTPRQRQAGYYLEFNMSTLLRGDQKSMADAFAKGIQWGWLSINDVRRMLNLNAVEGGDTYLRPMNMTSITSENDVNNNIVDQIKNLIDLAGQKGNING